MRLWTGRCRHRRHSISVVISTVLCLMPVSNYTSLISQSCLVERCRGSSRLVKTGSRIKTNRRCRSVVRKVKIRTLHTYTYLGEWTKGHGEKMGCVENAGVDTSARYGKGGQCRSGQFGTVLQGWKQRQHGPT